MNDFPRQLQLNVSYINQSEKWPTGCESVSAVMLLNYLGLPIDVDTFISFLPKMNFRKENDLLIGGDPNRCFIGSPYDEESFGCYAPVMAETLNRVFEHFDAPFLAKNATGTATEELLNSLINDLPVLYWTTIDLLPYRIGPSWYVEENGTLKEFTWRSNEHCMLLTGWDEQKLFFHDPWKNHGLIGHDRDLVITRHHEQYDMAVIIERL